MTTRNFKKVSFSFHEDMIAAMKEVVEKRKLSGPSELMRGLFQAYYEGDFRKNFLGYQAGIETVAKKGKRTATADLAARIEQMSEGELTAFLSEVGFPLEKYTPDPNNNLQLLHDYVMRDGGGKVVVYREYVTAGDRAHAGGYPMYTISDLIKELKKRKLI